MNPLLKKAITLAFANLIVLIPFTGWTSALMKLLPGVLRDYPHEFSLIFVLKWFAAGCLFAAFANLFIILPALFRLHRKNATTLSAYLKQATLWTLAASLLVGIVYAVQDTNIMMLPLGTLLSIILITLPVFLVTIIYWHVTTRPDKPQYVLFLTLFILWNALIATIAAFASGSL